MADIINGNVDVNRPRLALIGCGKIAEFHAAAFREAGFDLQMVCSRPSSTRVQLFAERHGIPHVYHSVDEIFRAREEWDALLIAISIPNTMDVLVQALDAGKPVLVEKPVVFRSNELLPLAELDLPVLVGYNRRFYRTVQEARREVEEGPPVLAQLSIPESITYSQNSQDDPSYLRPFFANTVHGLDMTRYIFGDLSVEHVQRISSDSGTKIALAATLITPNGSVVQFTANWGSPANFSLDINRPGRRLELRPFEAAVAYEGMEVQEPTDQTPIRTYVPKTVGVVDIGDIDRQFKPGFVAQAQALGALVRGEETVPAARLVDAYEVLKLAEQLAGEVYQAD